MKWSQFGRHYSDNAVRLPLILTAPKPLNRADATAFIGENKAELLDIVSKAGAVVLRGMGKDSVEGNQAMLSALGENNMVSYKGGGGAERQVVSRDIITVTPSPSFVPIPMHNELAYTTNYPDYVCFFCRISAKSGGSTSLADGEKVFNAIDPEISDKFAKEGVYYKRFMFNHSPKIKLGVRKSWQETFQTDNKLDVESQLENENIEYTWKKDGLYTRLQRPATNMHPVSGNPVWFNNLQIFAQHRPVPRLISSLLFPGKDVGVEYGDGSPISLATLKHINQAIDKNLVNEPWIESDILLVDNLACMHGRDKFRGKRAVTVGMFKNCN